MTLENENIECSGELISVVTITYGHEKYIINTIDGVLMQNYNGPIEFIIANDKSPDNTDEIVKKYLENKFIPPNIEIKYTCHKENKGAISNFSWALKQAKGKYIALCEGDDYWTDPFKLQKQVDFLESNHDYGLIHTNCVHNKNGTLVKNNNNENVKDGNVFEYLITHKFYISTLTVCVRRDFLLKWVESIEEACVNNRWKMFDYPLWLKGSLNTKFKYINEVTACYRVLSESVSHSRNKNKRYLFYKSVYDIKFYFTSIMELNPKIIQEIKTEYYKGLLSYGKYNLTESTKGLIYLVKKKALNLRMFFVYLKNILF